MKKLLLAFTAVLVAGAAHAQTQNQFQTTPWSGYAPARIQCGQVSGVNFNVTTDTAIPISVPTAKFMIDSIQVDNASTSMTTAAGGVYSAASKGGVAIVANSQAYSTLTSATANTTGNALLLTLATAGNATEFQGWQQTSRISQIYFSLTTGQGAAATATIRVYCRPLYGPN